MAYVLRLKDVYYTDALPYPWTFDLLLANHWETRDIPDKIIEYWSKVHYQRLVVINGKPRVVHSAIGGRYPVGAEVVEV